MNPCEVLIMGYLIDCSTAINAILTIASLVLSVVAIIFTHRSLKIQREHNQKSVKPIASIFFKLSKEEFLLTINNSGTGPLILKQLKIILQNHKYDFLYEIFPENFTSQYKYDYFILTQPTTLIPGSNITLFKMNFENKNKHACELIAKTIGLVSIETNYLDIYDNEFSQN